MKINDIIKNWILETEMFEMAFTRKDAINKVRGLQQPLAKHIVKYLHYDVADETRSHWESEIDGWLLQIDELRLKGGKKLSSDVYYHYLFKEPLGETTDLEGIIKNIDKRNGMDQYSKLGNVYELNEKCEKLMHLISYDLSNDKFEDFEYYMRRV